MQGLGGERFPSRFIKLKRVVLSSHNVVSQRNIWQALLQLGHKPVRPSDMRGGVCVSLENPPAFRQQQYFQQHIREGYLHLLRKALSYSETLKWTELGTIEVFIVEDVRGINSMVTSGDSKRSPFKPIFRKKTLSLLLDPAQGIFFGGHIFQSKP